MTKKRKGMLKSHLKKVNKKKDSDKSTLGDLDVLADLKKKMVMRKKEKIISI